MPKVSLPMASWETVIAFLESAEFDGYLLGTLINEIRDQVYSQEY